MVRTAYTNSLLLPLQAGVGEGGQGAAHGCGRRVARRGEEKGGFRGALEGEQGKARLSQVPDCRDRVWRGARAGARATIAFIPEGRGGAPELPTNKKLGLSLAREEAGRGARRAGRDWQPPGPPPGAHGAVPTPEVGDSGCRERRKA